MLLDATTRKLQIVLTAAKTTNDMPVFVYYVDTTATGLPVPGSTPTNSNGVTVVDILAAPAASTQRKVNSLTVNNADTAAKTVQVYLDDNSTDYLLCAVTLQTGDVLGYTDTRGWYVNDSAGNLKVTPTNAISALQVTNTPAGNIAATTVQAAINELDSEKAALAGSTSQVFSVAAATAAAHAVRADQGFLAQDFRLSLTTGVPVTADDVIGATTIYAVPKTGNRIALYNGTIWVNYSSAEFSLALGTLTSGIPYDVFCYQNSGVPTLEFLVWTNNTTRATVLAYNNGILIKSGDITRRYLGTFFTTSTTQTEDSKAKRFLWNYYHRTKRFLLVQDSTDSWVYTIAAYQQARANGANQLDMVIGVNEDMVHIRLNTISANTIGNVIATAGIGIDSGSVNSATLTLPSSNAANAVAVSEAVYVGYPGIGRHFYAWLEKSVATGVCTWYGDAGDGTSFYSGIYGEVSG